MRCVVSNTEMKALERYTIENIGIPSIVLMERAALSVRDEIMSVKGRDDKVLVVCGVGNNGADGLAVARLLHEAGIFCAVRIVGDRERATDEWKLQYRILEQIRDDRLCFVTTEAFSEYNIIVDAIFGIGLIREIEGCFKEAIEGINSVKHAIVVAVDIPSGINGETAKVLGCAVKADITVTFGFEKLGCRLFPGREYCGRVSVKDIGIVPPVSELLPRVYTHTPEDYELLPKRNAYSNKGSYGKLFVISGSKNMTGAAWFCAGSAYRCGTGLVAVLATAPQVVKTIQSKLPEAVIINWNNEEFRSIIRDRVKSSDAVVCGPGLGTDEAACELVRTVLETDDRPVVLDADALNIIAGEQWHGLLKRNMIITPHLGEMARLTGKTIDEIQEDLPGTAAEFAGQTGVTVILKDAVTVIADEQGIFYVNSSGNSGMATAGSGDALSGIVGAMYAMTSKSNRESSDNEVLGENMSGSRLCASLSVYIHGLCGDYARNKIGERPLLARDISKALEKVMGEDTWKQLM